MVNKSQVPVLLHRHSTMLLVWVVELDKCNTNSSWQDSAALEMTQLHEYKIFKDLGKGAKAPKGYKKM